MSGMNTTSNVQINVTAPGAQQALQQVDQLNAKVAQTKTNAQQSGSAVQGLADKFKALTGEAKNLASGSGDLQSGFDAAKEAVGGLAEALGGVGGGLRIVAVGIGATVAALALGAAAVVGITLAMTNAAGAMDDLANETGITTERLSLLQNLAAEGGSSFEAWNSAAEGLASKLAKGGEESSKTAIALKKLGVELKDNEGNAKSYIELMREVVTNAAEHEDAAEGQALALAALGPAYNKIKTSVIEAKEKQSEMYDLNLKTGNYWSGSFTKAAGDFGDKVDRLKGAFQGMAISVAQAVLPVLDRLMAGILKASQAAAQVVAKWMGNNPASEKAQDEYDRAATEAANAGKAISKIEGTEFANSAAGAKELERQRERQVNAQAAMRELARARDQALKAEADAKKLALTGSEDEKGVAAGVVDKDKPEKEKKEKEKDYFGDLQSKLQGQIIESNAAIQNEGDLTKAAKERLKLEQEILENKTRYTPEQQKQLFAQIDLMELAEKEEKQSKETREAEAKHSAEMLKQSDEREAIYKAFGDLSKESVERIEEELANYGLTNRQIQLNADLKKIEIGYQEKLNELIKAGADEAAKARLAGQKDSAVNARMGAENKLTARDNDMWGGLTNGLKQYAGVFTTTFDMMSEMGTRVAGTLENAFSNMARGGKLSFKDFANAVIADMGAIAAKAAVSGIAKLLIGAIGGAVSSAIGGGGITAATGAAAPTWGAGSFGTGGGVSVFRAAGGPVKAGQTAWVGEQGRELVTFGQDAYVSPAHASAGNGGGIGSVSISAPIYITNSGKDTDADLARKFAEAHAEQQRKIPDLIDAQIAKQLNSQRGLLAHLR